jgi:hypothetical protein
MATAYHKVQEDAITRTERFAINGESQPAPPTGRSIKVIRLLISIVTPDIQKFHGIDRNIYLTNGWLYYNVCMFFVKVSKKGENG